MNKLFCFWALQFGLLGAKLFDLIDVSWLLAFSPLIVCIGGPLAIVAVVILLIAMILIALIGPLAMIIIVLELCGLDFNKVVEGDSHSVKFKTGKFS